VPTDEVFSGILRANNLEIPARFSFRPYIADWNLTWAEVIDWAEEDSLKPVMALRPAKPARKTGEGVIVRVIPPVDIGNALGLGLNALGLGPTGTSGMLGLYGESGDSLAVDVEILRKDLPDGLLHPNETPITAPDIAGREFVVLVTKGPECGEGRYQIKAGKKEKNVWLMRDSFFGLDPSVAELRKFLNRWGLWNEERRFPVKGFLLQSQLFSLVVPDAIWRQREAYRKALSGSARSWLRAARPLSFSPLDEWPHFLVERSSCQDAIEATITIEHLRGAKFGFCKRCRKIFERDTLHKKNYCSRKCIQADATARWRANQRKQSKKQGGK
jgi:hypothetical protein